MLPIFGIRIGANSQISVVKGPVLQRFHVFVEGQLNGVFGYPHALQKRQLQIEYLLHIHQCRIAVIRDENVAAQIKPGFLQQHQNIQQFRYLQLGKG